MDFFWDTVETVNRTECKGFSHFDTSHIIWLVLFLCVCIWCAWFYRKRTYFQRSLMRYAFAVLLIADEVMKYWIIHKGGVPVIGYLPLQLCSICIILVIIHCFVPWNHYIGNFLYLVGLAAGLSALLFPSWTALPAFANLMSIHSFTVHIMLVSYIVMMICAKEIRPEFKTIPVSVCALIAMAICVFIFDLISGTNYMYLVHLSPASPLAPFEALGDYRIGYAIILAGLVFVLYVPPALVRWFSKA